MSRHHSPLTLRGRLHRSLVCLATVLLTLSACGRDAPGAAPAAATRAATQPPALVAQPAATDSAVALPTPRPTLPRYTPMAGKAAGAPAQLTAWPAEAFRYELRLRPAGQPDEPETVITGQYSAGAWQQAQRTGDQPVQELIVWGKNTYTRAAGDATWTRWPGVEFDMAYGLPGPFAVRRLYPQVAQATRGELAPVQGAAEPTFRKQTIIAADTISRSIQAGIAALAPDAQSASMLSQQAGALAVQQTVNYWVGESGQIYRAAATLLEADANGQPAPWMEATWRFWDYGDPRLAVKQPADFQDAGETLAAPPGATVTPAAAAAVSATAGLSVRVFASPGVTATNAAVTVYAAGDTAQPVAWQERADASFTLPAGQYDVRVQANYAEEWLRGVTVAEGAMTGRVVTFDFGTLRLTVTRQGQAIAADIVTYPAGNRDDWVDWRSDNPATIPLRAGAYDVEIAYGDYKAIQRVTGLVIRAGAVTTKTVEAP